MKDKLLVAAIAVIILIGAFLGLKGSAEKEQYVANEKRIVTAEELFKLRSDSEDSGVIKKYSTSTMSENANITYINEQGRVQNISINNLYVMGDIEKFEESSFVLRTFSNKTLTNDQIGIIANALSSNGDDAQNMIDKLVGGSSLEIGFVVGSTPKE